MEQWTPIEDFPGYEVSDHGQVRNGTTGYVLGQYDNGHGILQVVMRRGGRNHARAVHRLVAEGFLHPAPEGAVPMHRDGDWGNNVPSNLVWKPRWFAIKWTRQRKQDEPKDLRRVRVVSTGDVYETSLDCARAIGGLEELVILTAQSHQDTTYMGSKFEFIAN